MRREMNILAMAKGKERYIFLYDDQSYEALIDVFDRFAENEDLNFSTGDAALLGQKARESVTRYGTGFPTFRDV
ncbi:MAG: hypothetical protein HY000_19800 [Planctomycetes bacterium]|nr:hypothetical protein [Planctomycetota bacterium]